VACRRWWQLDEQHVESGKFERKHHQYVVDGERKRIPTSHATIGQFDAVHVETVAQCDEKEEERASQY
jgi:hypothetical protein